MMNYSINMVYDLDTVFMTGKHADETVAEVLVSDRRYLIDAWKNGLRLSNSVISKLGFTKTSERVLSEDEVKERRVSKLSMKPKIDIASTTIDEYLDELERESADDGLVITDEDDISEDEIEYDDDYDSDRMHVSKWNDNEYLDNDGAWEIEEDF
jgi:hypothetical protein